MLRNPFKAYRINSVFFFSFSVMIMVLFGLVTLLSYQKSTEEITGKVSYYQQRLLNELNEKVTTNLVGIERTAITASKNSGVLFDRLNEGDQYDQNRVQNEIRTQLNNFVFSLPILQSIHLYYDNPLFSDVHEWVQFYPMDQIAKESWYDQIENSDSAWIGEHMIETNKGSTPVISFALKAYNNSSNNYALIVLNVQVSSFQSFITPSGEQSSITLLDGTGKQITHIGKSLIPKQTIEDIISSSDEKNGVYRLENDLIVWSTSMDSRWTVVETTPWKELTEGTIEIAKMLAILGITAVIVALIMVVFLTRQFTKPISILLKAMNNFPIKKKSEDIPKDYGNEFGGLFHGYHKLVRRIDELYKSLEENHKRQTVAEIKSLQMMINPHFLYNTLDQINWMAIETEQTKISSMLSHVAHMFRMSLSNQDSLVPVHEEVAHIQHYLQFQSIRWEDQLNYTIEIEEQLKDCVMPKFILQPFIENAFVHGFHGKKHALISVRIFEQNEQLVIEIEDNGKGIGKALKLDVSGKTGGHGLYNVNERIEAMFGAPSGFSLLPNENGAGTLVRIKLPILKKEGV